MNRGDKVRVISLPPDWDLPDHVLYKDGIIIAVNTNSYTVEFRDFDERWNFPKHAVVGHPLNKYNPKGYVPRFDRLPLP